MIIKGILDVEDARDAVKLGADGIVVSNHGGRQLDGVLSFAKALPAIADAVKSDLKIFIDSVIRQDLMLYVCSRWAQIVRCWDTLIFMH